MATPISSRRRGAPTPHLRMAGISTSAEGIVTTVFVSNLHCSSCVDTIEGALSSLSPAPTSTQVSIVTQAVTVHHRRGLSPAVIKAAIDEAGFDIVATPVETVSRSPMSLSHSISAMLAPRQRRHVAQCSMCQAEQAAGAGFEQGPSTDRDAFIPVPAIDNAPSAAVDLSQKHPDAAGLAPPPGDRRDGPGPCRVVLSVGGMTCASCSNTITDAVDAVPGASHVVVNLLANSATLNVDRPDLVPAVLETIDDVGYEAELISVEPLVAPTSPRASPKVDPNGPHRLSLSIGGMTCASCSNTVTDVTSAIPGVSDVVVNLLGHSASVVVERKDLALQVVEAIEDAGYEPEVISAEPVQTSDDKEDFGGPRTESLRIDGMFCPHCPDKVMSAIASFGPRITVLKPITSYTDPILRISYVPAPPSFTLRTISHVISASSMPSSPFTVSIHHPPTLEARARHMQQREQWHLLQRLIFSVIVAIPTFIIGIVYMDLVPATNATRKWFERPMWAGNTARAVWAMFFLATPVMFFSAGTFHRRSLKEIWALWKPGSRTPVWKRFVKFGSMNLLVSTGVSVAYFSSIALLALAATQPSAPFGPGDTTTYFDSVVFLTMFLLCGRYLEAYSKSRTADAITALGKLRPSSALVLVSVDDTSTSASDTSSTPPVSQHDVDVEKGDPIREDTALAAAPGMKFERVDAEFLDVGDVVRVQHGASPPADGTVVAGAGGAFDESSLTGESRLVKKQAGDPVFVGTINKAGLVDVRVDAIGGETMLDHVVKVVREGQTRRAPIERIADHLTGYFVPVVTLLAIITWVVWLALGLSGALPASYLNIDVGGWPVWSLEFAIAVFVVACPCGIGLAAPTALLVGSGLAAKYGILARGGGEAFQEAAQLDIVVFDKTGTLTEGGEPRVTDAELVDGAWARAVVLGVAAEIEAASSHPLATALRQYCEANAAAPQTGSAFEETPGRGLKAAFEALHCTAIIGNEAWLGEHQCAVDGRVADILHAWKSEGKSVILLALRGEKELSFSVTAAFAVADPLRPEAQGVLARLHEQGIGTWMISGDNEITAKAVARSVGIPETNVIAGVLPHEKGEKIQWLQQVGMKRQERGWGHFLSKKRLNERCIVAMVGDGINDAPALIAADVGIAIGSGSDVALSSASFILVSSNLQSLLTLTDLSRKVFNRVKFNFLWATIYNTVAIPIAAGVIYPAGNARLPPVWASLTMALSSVSVVCSSLLLRLYKEPSIHTK